MILDSIGYSATAPSTGAAAAAVSGDSLTIRAARPGSVAQIVGLIACNQGAGYHQVVGPGFNDTTRGIRVRVPASEAREYLKVRAGQRVEGQDLLSVTVAGSAVAGDIENGVLLVAYEEVGGLAAVMLTAEELRRRTVRLVTVYASLASGTSGGWSGAELITAESDLLRANTPYAVLGCQNSVEACAIGIRAPDWSNLRIAIPGHDLDAGETADFLPRLSERLGLGLIPVFNSANRNNIWLDCLQDENGGDPVVSLMLAELSA